MTDAGYTALAVLWCLLALFCIVYGVVWLVMRRRG
jgi:hypothetical protein